MILNKTEQDGNIKAIYESSNILASEYNPNTKDLTIIFKVGSRYRYRDVSMTDYTRFEVADSQGKLLNSHIKKYTFEKLDSVNPETLLKEVADVKLNEAKSKSNELVSVLKELTTTYDESLGISAEQIKILESYINRYKEVKL